MTLGNPRKSIELAFNYASASLCSCTLKILTLTGQNNYAPPSIGKFLKAGSTRFSGPVLKTNFKPGFTFCSSTTAPTKLSNNSVCATFPLEHHPIKTPSQSLSLNSLFKSAEILLYSGSRSKPTRSKYLLNLEALGFDNSAAMPLLMGVP
jgi:hypothetical protein